METDGKVGEHSSGGGGMIKHKHTNLLMAERVAREYVHFRNACSISHLCEPLVMMIRQSSCRREYYEDNNGDETTVGVLANLALMMARNLCKVKENSARQKPPFFIMKKML